MPRVFVPALLRHLANDQESIEVPGATVRELINALDVRFPGIKARLGEGDNLRPGLAVVIDSQVAHGLDAPVAETSEVHFIPAIAGGRSSGLEKY
jgi:molybdopterin converting factor small subunit